MATTNVTEAPKFKVGDRVRVTERRGGPFSALPALIVSDEGFAQFGSRQRAYRIVTNSGKRGFFYEGNLEALPEQRRTRIKSSNPAYYMAAEIARRIAKKNRVVTADDVQNELRQIGFNSINLGNAAGVVFRGREWRKVGFVNSTRNHGRVIAKWELASQ